MSNHKRSDKPYGGRTPYAEALTQINTDATPATESTIKLDEIRLPQQQPRRYFDPQALKELVSSVRQHGLLQPLLVRPIESGGYELVAGERRYRAARELGLEEVPVVVRQLADDQAFQFALIENLQREDLNPIEETEGILQLLALRLKCDSSDVKSLLYRMKNALDKKGKTSKGKGKSRRNASPKLGKSESSELTSQSNGNVSANLELAEDEYSRNVSTNSDTSAPESIATRGSTDSDATQEPTELGDITAETRKNVSPLGETTENESSRTVSTHPDDFQSQTVIEVFESLGQINWLSFTTKRLPLLNLPAEILTALREGKLEYTKATALAQVKDDEFQKQLLSEAIAKNWSLSEIKQQIAAASTARQAKTSDDASQIPERFKAAYQKLKKTRLWSDPTKEQQLDTLLTQLEALLGD